MNDLQLLDEGAWSSVFKTPSLQHSTSFVAVSKTATEISTVVGTSEINWDPKFGTFVGCNHLAKGGSKRIQIKVLSMRHFCNSSW
jgi:hypothetical protein